MRGIYYILWQLQLHVTALVLVGIQLAIPVGRYFLEGRFYNVSRSSFPGDTFLFTIVLIAAALLQGNRELFIPRWLDKANKQLYVLAASFAVCLAVSELTLTGREGQVMDIYHDLVVAPLLLFFAVTLLPLIYKNGSKKQIIAVVFCIMVWVNLVTYDVITERLNQRQWLRNHGVVLQR